MRLVLGSVVVVDLSIRGSDLFALYGVDGVWPSAYVYSFSGKPGMWSLHTLFGNDAWLVFLFSIQVLAAIGFLVGYKTKASNFVLWLLTVSLHNRNVFVLQAGDDLLRMLLFWGMFLPWDRHYCVVPSKSRTTPNGMGQMAYLLLLASVYYFTAELKYSAQWRSEFSAVYHALSLDMYRSYVGSYVYQYPMVMQWLTRTTLAIEYLLPILILWPSKKGHLRVLAFLLLAVLHIGFALCLKVGLFYVISLSAGIGLLPESWFGRSERSNTAILNSGETSFSYKHVLNSILIFAVMTLCLLINLSSLPWFAYQPKKEIVYVANACRFDQFWGMFAPAVPSQNKWLVYMAFNAKGQQHDILHDSDYVDFTHNALANNQFKNDRWKKLAENVQSDYFPFLRTHYCRYFLKRWNKKHPYTRMHHLTLYSMSETVLLNYRKEAAKKKLLCLCDEE
jgi:hypothetical protein